MGFIRHFAVKSYLAEMRKFIELISNLDIEDRARILAYGTWLRSILQNEGKLPVIRDDKGDISPELYAFPIMLENLEDAIKFMRRKTEGGKSKSLALEIWVHSLRAILRPEIAPLACEMWAILLESKAYCEKYIIELANEDIRHGIPKSEVIQFAQLAKSIIDTLPPVQLSKA